VFFNYAQPVNIRKFISLFKFTVFFKSSESIYWLYRDDGDFVLIVMKLGVFVMLGFGGTCMRLTPAVIL
jgi:hypothetical protein